MGDQMYEDERDGEMPEILQPIQERAQDFKTKAAQLRESARAGLANKSERLARYVQPAKKIGIGALAVGTATAIDVGEGAIMAAITGGASELVPITEMITDLGSTAFIEKVYGIEIPMKYKVAGTVLGALPVVGDVLSPGALYGSKLVVEGIGELWNANKNPSEQVK